MKRVYNFFVIVISVFLIVGCNKVDESFNGEFPKNSDNKNLNEYISNFDKSLEALNGFSFSANFMIDEKEYTFTGKVILKNIIEKSIVKIDYNGNSFYLKDGKVFVSYFYKNTNVIIKDSLENFVEEIVGSLTNKGIICNKDKILELIKNKNVKDLNVDLLRNYISFNNDNYELNYKGYRVEFNDSFLPNKVSYNGNKLLMNLIINYEDVSIHIPVGYNILTLDIKDVKKLLRINYISDLLK